MNQTQADQSVVDEGDNNNHHHQRSAWWQQKATEPPCQNTNTNKSHTTAAVVLEVCACVQQTKTKRHTPTIHLMQRHIDTQMPTHKTHTDTQIHTDTQTHTQGKCSNNKTKMRPPPLMLAPCHHNCSRPQTPAHSRPYAPVPVATVPSGHSARHCPL